MKSTVNLIVLLCFFVLPGMAQTNAVSGRVTDLKTGSPLSGVSVALKGTSVGANTNKNGDFKLNAPSASTILVVTNVGYKSQELSIANSGFLDIKLQEDATNLGEVVVVGYGVMKKSSLTGAITKISSSTLNTLPTGNVVEALQGKVAGVSISAATTPGSSPTIRIRGVRSLTASNDPLFVVDGIPRNSVSDLPVSEIESVEVLKDAASTAIYGSRGANGVIIYTTKRAKLNQPIQISVSSYVGVDQPKIPKIISPLDYIQFRKDIYRQQHGWANGYGPDDKVFYPGELKTIQNGNYVNWQDLLFRKNTINQEHNISVSHGSDKTQVLLSLGYRTEEGYYRTSKNTRLNIGANIDYNLTRDIKFGLSSRVTSVNTDGYNSSGSGGLAYMNPLAQPYDDNGNLKNFPAEIQQGVFNVLANYVNPYKNNTLDLRNFDVLYTEFSFLKKSLRLRTNLGIDYRQTNVDQFKGQYSYDQSGRANYGLKQSSSNTNFTLDNILSYLKDIGSHSINVTLVSSLQQQKDLSSFGSGEGFPVEVISNWNLGAATSNIRVGSSYSKNTITSYLGRAQYGYKEKYLVNASFRADGSSVLAPGNKWGYFPSVSAAWVINKENFFHSNTINYLKLRGSYGTVGNSAISPYSTIYGTNQVGYNFGTNYYYGFSLGSLVNPELRWEYSTTGNVGLEFGLFNNRLSGTLEVYHTATKDLLLQRTLPALSGFTGVLQNVGRTSNRGIELGISTTNYSKKYFQWKTDFNFYYDKQRIDQLITNEDLVGNNWFIGKPLNVFYDYQKIGIWQTKEAAEAAKYARQPGEIKIKDQNNDGSIDAVHDKIILGQRDPKFNLFLRNQFTYKNFTISVALESKLGYLVNSDMLGGTIFFDGTRQIAASVYHNYWTPDNPGNNYPRLGESVPQNLGLMGIRKADYINVQEISLGYSFNQFKLLKTLYVYARVKNPFYLYRADKDIDPQAPGFDISAYRTGVIGLNVNF